MTEIPGAFDDDLITVGIDWYKTCTPLLLEGSFWAPTPLFIQQHPVQFVIVSFSGWTGSRQGTVGDRALCGILLHGSSTPIRGSSGHKIPYRFAG